MQVLVAPAGGHVVDRGRVVAAGQDDRHAQALRGRPDRRRRPPALDRHHQGPARPRRGPDDGFGRQAPARRGLALQPERGHAPGQRRRACRPPRPGPPTARPTGTNAGSPAISVEEHAGCPPRPRPATRSGAGPASAGCRGRRARCTTVASGAPRAPPATGPSWTLTSMNPSSVIEPSCVSWTIEPDVATGLRGSVGGVDHLERPDERLDRRLRLAALADRAQQVDHRGAALRAVARGRRDSVNVRRVSARRPSSPRASTTSSSSPASSTDRVEAAQRQPPAVTTGRQVVAAVDGPDRTTREPDADRCHVLHREARRGRRCRSSPRPPRSARRAATAARRRRGRRAS